MQREAFIDVLDELLDEVKVWRDARSDWKEYEAGIAALRQRLIDGFEAALNQSSAR